MYLLKNDDLCCHFLKKKKSLNQCITLYINKQEDSYTIVYFILDLDNFLEEAKGYKNNECKTKGREMLTLVGPTRLF